jgi:hypothetical protein
MSRQFQYFRPTRTRLLAFEAQYRRLNYRRKPRFALATYPLLQCVQCSRDHMPRNRRCVPRAKNPLRIFRRDTPVARLALIRLAQLHEIELFHFEERQGHTRDLIGAAVAHHFIHLGGNDLPGNAEFILEPAALLGFRNGG